jgi:hypothetical protein
MILTYAVVDFVIRYLGGESLGINELVKALLPICSYRYWYFSCYFLLIIFSPVINFLAAKLSRKLFAGMLLLWIFVVSSVSVLPLFGFVDDYFWKVIFYYLAGRYISKYGLNLFKEKRTYLLSGMVLVFVTFLLNVLTTIIKGNIIIWFASDVFMLKEISVIFIFYYFVNCTYTNIKINKLATFVPAVYLAESTVRYVMSFWAELDAFYESPLLICMVFLIEIVVYVIVVVVESIRRFLSGPIEKLYAEMVEKMSLSDWFMSIIEKV